MLSKRFSPASILASIAHSQPALKGDVIELAAEHLPEETAEQKKRKKALILFLRSWKNLKTEVGRVGKELDTQNESPSQRQQTRSVARIISGAKGPLGVITIIAVVAVVASQFVSPKTATLKVIQVSDKSIPLDALVVASGTECQNNAPHYHATDHQAARALDGTMVPDPGGCGYGTVSQTQIVEVTP